MALTRYYIVKDYEITQSDDWTPSFQISINDVIQTINVNYTWKLSITTSQKDISDGSTPDYAHVDFPITATFPDSQTAKFTVSKTILGSLALGTYYYDVQVTDPANLTTTRQKGKVTITGQSTK